jgi:hypothetical protein
MEIVSGVRLAEPSDLKQSSLELLKELKGFIPDQGRRAQIAGSGRDTGGIDVGVRAAPGASSEKRFAGFATNHA